MLTYGELSLDICMTQDLVSPSTFQCLRTPTFSSEWPEIMRCFDILIKRLGARIWLGEGPEFPLVIFDSIKDNPQFINRIHETGGNRRSIIWFIEYLSLIHDPSIHSQVCLKMLGLLCEELQHERFSDCRPPLISFAATVGFFDSIQTSPSSHF